MMMMHFREIPREEAWRAHPRPPGAKHVPAALVDPATGRRSLFASGSSAYADCFRGREVRYAASVLPEVNARIDEFASGGQPVDFYAFIDGKYYHARVRVFKRTPREYALRLL